MIVNALTLAIAGILASTAASPLQPGRASRFFDRRYALYANWPSYDDLPLDKSYPTKAAWGTPSSLPSARYARDKPILLNLRLGMPDPPANLNRKPLTHLYQLGDGYTDVISLNMQISTQYDGLRHFPYSANNSVGTYQWYNDLIPGYDDVIGPPPSEVLKIQTAAERGIAVRGVLLDWAGWMDSKNCTFDAFSTRDITVRELDAVAAWQGLRGQDWARPGDFLVVRIAWLRQYQALNRTQQVLLPLGDGFSVGMEASEDSLRWLWTKKLSIVGADNPAFESTPFNKTIHGEARYLHQIFIGGWGQSIVELLDLEKLAPVLHQLRRSTFFVTIQILTIVSGVASPPNAMAVL